MCTSRRASAPTHLALKMAQFIKAIGAHIISFGTDASTTIERDQYSDEIESELRSSRMSWFLMREVSSSDRMVFEVYENEIRRLLGPWGSIEGEHLWLGDRRRYTNDTGIQAMSSLASFKPMYGYKWDCEWTMVVDPTCMDSAGYQYALNWDNLKNSMKPSSQAMFTHAVRRRLWRRTLVKNTDAARMFCPFELVVRVRSGDIIAAVGHTSHCCVEVSIDDVIIGSTPVGPPDWNVTIIAPLAQIAPSTVVKCTVRSEAVLDHLLQSSIKGVVRVPYSDIIASTVRVGDEDQLMAGHSTGDCEQAQLGAGSAATMDRVYRLEPLSENRGTLCLGLELREHRLFSVQYTGPTVAASPCSTTNSSTLEQVTELQKHLQSCNLGSAASRALLASISTSWRDVTSALDVVVDLSSLLQFPPPAAALGRSFARSHLSADSTLGFCNIAIWEENVLRWMEAASSCSDDDDSATVMGDEEGGRVRDSQWTVVGIYAAVEVEQARVGARNYAMFSPCQGGVVADVSNYCAREVILHCVGMSAVHLVFSSDTDYYLGLKAFSAVKEDTFTNCSFSVQLKCVNRNSGRFQASQSMDVVAAVVTIDSEKSGLRFVYPGNASPGSNMPVLIKSTDIIALESCNAYYPQTTHRLEIALIVTAPGPSDSFIKSCVEVDWVDGQRLQSQEHQVLAIEKMCQIDFRPRIFTFDVNPLSLQQRAVANFENSVCVKFHSSPASSNSDGLYDTNSFIVNVPFETLCPNIKVGTSLLGDGSNINEIITKMMTTNFQLSLMIEKAMNLIGVDLDGKSDPYFVVYLADSKQKILAQPKSSKFTFSKSLPENAIFKSECINSNLSPVWNAKITVDARQGLMHSAFVIIEVWDSNNHRNDTCLGEVRLPVDFAMASSEDILDKRIDSLCSCSKMTTINQQKKNLGSLCSSVSFKLLPSSAPQTLAQLEAHVRLVPVCTEGSLSPCRFLALDTKVLDETVYLLDCRHDCLTLSCVASADAPSAGKSFTVSSAATNLLGLTTTKMSSTSQILDSCAEATGGSGGGVWNIPWSQVDRECVHALTETMLSVEIKIYRTFAGGINREVTMELIAGPCDAVALQQLILHRLVMRNARNLVTEALSSAREQSLEVHSRPEAMVGSFAASTARPLMHEIHDLRELMGELMVEKTTIDAIANDDNCSGNAIRSLHDHRAEYDSRQLTIQVVDLKKRENRLRAYLGAILDTLAAANQNVNVVTEAHAPFNLIAAAFAEFNQSTGTLGERLEEIMQRMEQDVCMLILQHLSKTVASDKKVPPSATVAPLTILAKLLSDLVHGYYLGIVNCFQEFMNGKGFDNIPLPQAKRELLNLIISNDDWITDSLTPMLSSCNMSLTGRAPALSAAIDFEELISKFSLLLNSDIQQWLKKSILAFMAERNALTSANPVKSDFASASTDALNPSSASAVAIGWELEPLEIRERGVNKMLHISHIPETIQTQLNVQIGTKKITSSTSMRPDNLRTVEKINDRLTRAVASSYCRLSDEYRKAAKKCRLSLDKIHEDSMIGKQNRGIFGFGYIVINESAPSDGESRDVDTSGLDFLLSIANDCMRVSKNHINTCKKKLISENVDDNGHTSDLFRQARMELERTTAYAIEQAVNSVFIDLEEQFLVGFEESWRHFATQKDENSSPLLAVTATFSEFIDYCSKCVTDDVRVMMVKMVARKLMLRYLLFIRNYLALERKRNAHASTRKLFVKPLEGAIALAAGDSSDQSFDCTALSSGIVLRIHADMAAVEKCVKTAAGLQGADLDVYLDDLKVPQFKLLVNTAVSSGFEAICNEKIDKIFDIFDTKLPAVTAEANQVAQKQCLVNLLQLSADNNFEEQKSGPAKFAVELSNFSCAHLKAPRKCYVRMTIDNLKKESSLQVENVHPSWHEKLVINLLSIENKSILIEVVESRPLRLRSERVHGRLWVPISGLDIDADNSDQAKPMWYTLTATGVSCGESSPREAPTHTSTVTATPRLEAFKSALVNNNPVAALRRASLFGRSAAAPTASASASPDRGGGGDVAAASPVTPPAPSFMSSSRMSISSVVSSPVHLVSGLFTGIVTAATATATNTPASPVRGQSVEEEVVSKSCHYTSSHTGRRVNVLDPQICFKLSLSSIKE